MGAAMLILNLGCGINRRRLYAEPFPEGTIHIDKNPDVEPTIVHDLEWGFPSETHDGRSLINSVDEIHAYHLIEHIGKMGETEAWFRFWENCWLALKPGGLMFIEAPWYQHEDAIGDPTHTRLICRQTFRFLDRRAYLKKDGDNGCAMSKLNIPFDFREVEWKFTKKNLADFIPCGLRMVLRAEKTPGGYLVALDAPASAEVPA